MTDQDTRIGQGQVTILRIKRKRNEEPLDALVVESSAKRKKSRGGMNVFQFAETVEQNAWEDEKLKEDLRSRISNLARESSRKSVQPTVPVLASGSVPSVQSTEFNDSPTTKPPRRMPQIDDPSRKYMIVPSDTPEPTVRTSRRPIAPPKVHSYKELQKASFTMYEAIPSSASLASITSPSAGSDHDMEKFLPMLQDYLRLNDGDPSVASITSTSHPLDEGADYVWDVFYSRPVTFRELYGSNTNIGTVTGLPDTDAYGSESDSDYEDEDDEDSNAEDWYKNDYPEEESGSGEDDGEGSDAFHENSDYEDVTNDRATALWEYR